MSEQAAVGWFIVFIVFMGFMANHLSNIRTPEGARISHEFHEWQCSRGANFSDC